MRTATLTAALALADDMSKKVELIRNQDGGVMGMSGRDALALLRAYDVTKIALDRALWEHDNMARLCEAAQIQRDEAVHNAALARRALDPEGFKRG